MPCYYLLLQPLQLLTITALPENALNSQLAGIPQQSSQQIHHDLRVPSTHKFLNNQQTYILVDILAVNFVLDDLDAIFIGLTFLNSLPNFLQKLPIKMFDNLIILCIFENLITKPVESPNRKSFHKSHHHRSSKYIYLPQTMKEMFRPFLNIPPKSQEIKNTRMHINNSI